MEKFIDRNPISVPLDKGMMDIANDIQKTTGLKNIFLGYNKLTETISDPPYFIGHTSLIGFDIKTIKEVQENFQNVYICYIAIPIDEDDCIIENGMLDWDFEKVLSKIINLYIITSGALAIGQFKRCRTFRFLIWF